MKSALILASVFFTGLTSFAQAKNYDWIFNSMNKAEEIAQRVSAPHHGEYFFGDKEARMLIFEEATLMHSVQLRKDGQMKNFSMKTDADKQELRNLITEGWDANALDTRLIQPVEVDGVVFNLLGILPNKVKGQTILWSAAQYTSFFPGLPGLRAKNNRTITLRTSAEKGELVEGEIYQVSITGLLQPKRLPLDLP